MPSIVPLSSIEKKELVDFFFFIPKIDLEITLDHFTLDINKIPRIENDGSDQKKITENVRKLEEERLFKIKHNPKL